MKVPETRQLPAASMDHRVEASLRPSGIQRLDRFERCLTDAPVFTPQHRQAIAQYLRTEAKDARFAQIVADPESLLSVPEKWAERWALTLEFLYPDRETYIQEIDKFLVSRFENRNETKILGVGSGPGWFEIGVWRLGWNVVWSDRSPEMKRFLEEDLQILDLDIPRVLTDCESLGKNIDTQFHAAFFRGGGFPYVAPFDDKNADSFADAAAAKIEACFRAIYHKLHPKGLFYVDLVGRHELNYFQAQRGNEMQPPLQDTFAPRQIGGKTVQLAREISYDFDRRIREGKRWFTIDGYVNPEPEISHGYLCDYNDLEDMLKKAGFSHVEERRFPGEETYVAFIATKD